MAAISVVALCAVTWFAIRSIKRRKTQQADQVDVSALVDLTALPGKPVAAARGQYVATVFTNNPLERVVTGGLMHRGKAQLVVTTDGIGIERIGEESFAIHAQLLRDIGRATATIDRGVEASGLLSISWVLGETEVTTQLRLDAADDTAEFNETLKKLVNKDGGR